MGQGYPFGFTNLATDTTNPHPLIFGNWNDLVIGFWSEIDLLVNPDSNSAFSMGNVQLRGRNDARIALRHPEFFAWCGLDLTGTTMAARQAATRARQMSAPIERRVLAIAIRAQGRRLVGYAATFGTPAEIDGRFTETIRAGAFAETLKQREDVLALVDHDASKLLGRTARGTLRLNEDARGLAFEVDVPPTTLGNDVLAMAARGDLGGMWFGFRTIADHWTDKRTRELRRVQLVEVSVVHAFPAYPATVVQARKKTLTDAIRWNLRRFPRRASSAGGGAVMTLPKSAVPASQNAVSRGVRLLLGAVLPIARKRDVARIYNDQASPDRPHAGGRRGHDLAYENRCHL